MKKLIFILALISMSAFSFAQDRTGNIKTGSTALAWPMAFTTADSIITSDSLVIQIRNPQKYLQHQTVTTTLATVSGSPSVVITLRGKVTALGTWTTIGTPVTWTSASNNPVTITSAAPLNYNYLKVSYVASGATQHSKVVTFEVKTTHVMDIGAAAAYVIGNGAGTIAVNSSDWDISTTGAMTGIGAITMNGLLTGTAGATVSGAAINLNASSNYATNIGTGSSNGAIAIGGNSNTVAINTSDWDINATGDMTGIGAITADGVITAGGGYTFTNVSPVIWAKGGSTVLATSGTDVACSNGARWWVEVDIPYNVTLTGVAYLVGSVGGTDSVVVQLHNSAGVEVATSKKTGANHGALVGTAAQFQSCPFYVGASATPYAAVAGKYYVSVQFNGTTAKFRTYPIPGSKFITGTAAGTWNTKADITPGTTFTADKGPIVMTY